MKILMLADPGSAHTIKWVNYLVKKNIEVYLFGMSDFNAENYTESKLLKIDSLKIGNRVFTKTDGAFSKINYLKAVPRIKKIIGEFKPDILHSHYASSYGFLGALSKFHPYIISVYGSDVFNFPQKNIFNKTILKFNLSKANKILSTSNVMVKEIENYSSKYIEVIPFGIDLDLFKPFIPQNNFFEKNDIVIGTVKTLEEKYGIEYLIRAFMLVKEHHPEIPLKLLIVGKGTKEIYYKKLVSELGISELTKFTGFISPQEIPFYHNLIDISVFVSLEESFGVSVLEASACAKPVIVSNAGGLPEIVENNKTGIIVEKQNVEETAAAIEKLLLDKPLRTKFGNFGRERVRAHFNFNNNVNQMINIYDKILSKEILKD